jgi:hypothetical protein
MGELELKILELNAQIDVNRAELKKARSWDVKQMHRKAIEDRQQQLKELGVEAATPAAGSRTSAPRTRKQKVETVHADRLDWSSGEATVGDEYRMTIGQAGSTFEWAVYEIGFDCSELLDAGDAKSQSAAQRSACNVVNRDRRDRA